MQMTDLRAKPPDGYMARYWAMLDADTDPSTGKAPLERATSPRDDNDLAILSTWLRWRILSQNADGRFSYAYALNLNNMRDEKGGFIKEAAIFFYLAKLSLSVDGARCVDKESPQAVAFKYEAQKSMQPLIAQLSQMSKKDKAAAMLEAASIEQMRGERPLIASLCMQGSRTILKALAGGSPATSMSAADPRAEGQLGKTYSVDTSGIAPELVPEAQWRQKRREILDGYVKAAAEAYTN